MTDRAGSSFLWLGAVGVCLASGVLAADAGARVTPKVGIATLGAIAAACWLYRRGRSLGDAPLSAAAFTAQAFAVGLIAFSGVSVGYGMKIGDPVLAAAAGLASIALLAGEGTFVAPRYVTRAVWLLVASGLVSVFFTTGAGANLGILARFVVALAITPLVVSFAGRHSLDRLLVLVEAWILSNAVSAAVALSDRFVHTSLSPVSGQFPGREAGLAYHPNALALACAICIPVAVTLALDSSRVRQLWLLALVGVMLAGILVSGSRGGLVATAAGLLIITLRRSNPRRVIAVAGLGAAAMAIGLHEHSAAVERLLGRQTARYYSVASSDEQRAVRLHQAIADVAHHPLTGVGLTHLRQAHDVYLQLLSSGGVLVLLAFALFAGGLVAAGRTLRTRIGVAALASLSAWLLAGIVENQIYDRFVYVPAGLVIAIAALEQGRKGNEARGNLD